MEQEIHKWKDKIPKLTQFECGVLQRNAPLGHIVFCNVELYKIFKAHFLASGGMTPSISKKITPTTPIPTHGL